MLKRSSDLGQTWSDLRVVWHDEANTCGDPCPIVDRQTGAIWLLLSHNLGTDDESRILAQTSTGTRTVWVSRSDDDGVAWSQPVEITKQVKRPDWTWYATGPGVGIQLRSGRLLAPCDTAMSDTREWYSHVIFSDDHGATWHVGGVVGPKCNESQAVELDDGSVLLNMRSYRGQNRRAVASSHDGGLSFSEPRDDPALLEPVCQASIISYPGTNNLPTSRLLFSNPASTKREKLTIRLSEDGGKSWPVAKELNPGPSAYSCLAILPDKHIGCLYERGNTGPYEAITFARFTLEWLTGASN